MGARAKPCGLRPHRGHDPLLAYSAKEHLSDKIIFELQLTGLVAPLEGATQVPPCSKIFSGAPPISRCRTLAGV